MLAAAYSLPASVFRALGGWMSDRWGARAVMYVTFVVSLICLFVLSYPETRYTVTGIEGPLTFSFGVGVPLFAILTIALGFVMSLGKAAVYKHIPVYYPYHVGAVGGLVGMIGGLGGFALPIAFGIMNDLTGVWTSCFMLMFAIVFVSLVWMHAAIRLMERRRHPALAEEIYLSDVPDVSVGPPPSHPKPAGRMTRVLIDWRPDDPAFWQDRGRRIAVRNLWISIPCLLLAFSVWLVWSVVVAKLPAIGFSYTTNELFWLAALPGLSGATLRIFYSFMVPIFGGRLWTTLSTASLLVPAAGIGLAVQDPETPYVFVSRTRASLRTRRRQLRVFDGETSASSFPNRRRETRSRSTPDSATPAFSVMQFAVPLAVAAGVFGALGGAPQTTTEGGKLWLQNAGFVWVPFLAICAVAAWFGMNDISSARASFREQAIIFRRKHNWIMCVLYTGTFGSFIGYSAGFPLLAKTQFPEIDSLQYVFLGPLVGALSRAATGWVSDRYGGGRVTFLDLPRDAARRRGRAFLSRHQGRTRRVLGLFSRCSWRCSSRPESETRPPSR